MNSADNPIRTSYQKPSLKDDDVFAVSDEYVPLSIDEAAQVAKSLYGAPQIDLLEYDINDVLLTIIANIDVVDFENEYLRLVIQDAAAFKSCSSVGTHGDGITCTEPNFYVNADIAYIVDILQWAVIKVNDDITWLNEVLWHIHNGICECEYSEFEFFDLVSILKYDEQLQFVDLSAQVLSYFASDFSTDECHVNAIFDLMRVVPVERMNNGLVEQLVDTMSQWIHKIHNIIPLIGYSIIVDMELSNAIIKNIEVYYRSTRSESILNHLVDAIIAILPKSMYENAIYTGDTIDNERADELMELFCGDFAYQKLYMKKGYVFLVNDLARNINNKDSLTKELQKLLDGYDTMVKSINAEILIDTTETIINTLYSFDNDIDLEDAYDMLMYGLESIVPDNKEDDDHIALLINQLDEYHVQTNE